MPEGEVRLGVPRIVTSTPPERRVDEPNRWEPVALRRSDIADLVRELLDGARVDADLRRALVVHPRGGPHGSGLAPSIQVAIEVLRPGEEARPPRRSSSALVLQLSGTADVETFGQRRRVGPLDVHTVPAWAVQHVVATGDAPVVRLAYSNAALLDHLGVHHVEAVAVLDGSVVRPLGTVRELPSVGPVSGGPVSGGPVTGAPGGAAGGARVEAIGDAWRLPYERLIDPPWVARQAWHWRWQDIDEELTRMATLDERYRGRRVCILHDPTTGATNGTTTTLFASMCIRPPGIVDRTHRHAAAGINYFIEGSGWSTVDGQRIEWDAGDLVFIAPGFATHHHASGPAPVRQLAVQDNPLHLAMGSLVWQEDLADPPRLLGAEPGFTTNRDSLVP